jgi:hypothetical protein
MENGIKNFDFDTVMDFTYKMLWDETYTQTKNRVNSGKNRYRIKNVYKRWMEETSKFLDEVKLKHPNVSYNDLVFDFENRTLTIKKDLK